MLQVSSVNTSEYICNLVRKDQTEEAKLRLRALIEEGLGSGPGRPLMQADEDELLAQQVRVILKYN